MLAYAYVCDACRHLVSRHGLLPLAPSVFGPYRCRDCGCEIPQSSRVRAVSREDFEAAFTSTGTPRF